MGSIGRSPPGQEAGLDFSCCWAGSLNAPLGLVCLFPSATPEAKEADAFKDAAFASTDVPLLRVPVVGRYSESALRKRIKGALS